MRKMVRDGRWVTDDDDFDRRGNAVWIVGGVLAAMALAATARRLARGSETASLGVGRTLLSSSTCKPTKDWELPGGIFLYFIGVFYLFIGIAIVCDDFFVGSLEKICEVLGLSDDVAGATFMAAGSSAPELASSAMSLINSGTDNAIGVGTIVGSAVFNILVIIGTTVIFAGQTLTLDWKPLARDCSFYCAAIIGIVATFNGGRIDWWEGLIFVFLYCVYIAFMWKNAFFMEWLDAKFGHRFGRPDPAVEMEEAVGGDELSSATRSKTKEEGDKLVRELSIAGSMLVGFAAQRFKAGIQGRPKLRPLSPGQLRAIRRDADRVTWNHHHHHRSKAQNATAIGEDSNANAAAGNDDDDDERSPWEMPAELKDRPIWVLSLPWYAMFTTTVPPCHKEKWEKWYLLSFGTSIAWIGVISHFMVEWCARIGCLLEIPPVVMGTTVLAAGTSIPDALSSISVAKDGYADMAVANAVGSNVFDIWLGLGLPWLCYLSWQNPTYILVNTDELLPSALILLGVLIFYIVSVSSNKFRLTKQMGYVYLVFYGVYALYNIFLVWVLDVYKLGE